MRKCFAVKLIFATFFSVSEVSLAKSDVIETIELNGWYLLGKDTLAFYDLDGGARTSFLMKLSDGKMAIASFSWPVTPNAKPSARETILVVDGKLKDTKAHLIYDFQAISGTISASQTEYAVQVSKKDIRRIDIWLGKNRKFSFLEFDKLLAPLPLKVVKPASR